LSQWYKRFYDHIQLSVEAYSVEEATAMNTNGTRFDAVAAQNNIMWLLLEFTWIVIPLLVIHPCFKLFRSFWVFEWRMQLSQAYVRRWKVDIQPIEGAAQRVQEDTNRFARGVETTVSVILDSICTLVAFSPILIEIGSQVAPPWAAPSITQLSAVSPIDQSAVSPIDQSGSGEWGDPSDVSLPVPEWSPYWLWLLASTSAIGGIGISAFVGRHLVVLEVNNQTIEAHFRKQLIHLETYHANGYSERIGGATKLDLKKEIDPTWKSLRKNYYSLFFNFMYMNLWLGVFDQTNVIVPYLLAAHRLFETDPSRRITLGLLVQLSSCYGRIFDSLAIVTENWAAVNDWRSVLRRLNEYERTLYDHRFTTELIHGTISSSHDLPAVAPLGE
jgi:peptide/bleomycin uptake transporter